MIRRRSWRWSGSRRAREATGLPVSREDAVGLYYTEEFSERLLLVLLGEKLAAPDGAP